MTSEQDFKLSVFEAGIYADALRKMALSQDRRALLAQELEGCATVITHQAAKIDELQKALAQSEEEIDELRAEVEIEQGDVLRLLRARNAAVFAVQCMRQRLVRGQHEAALEVMTEWLRAGGWDDLPDHDLIAPVPRHVLTNDTDVARAAAALGVAPDDQ